MTTRVIRRDQALTFARLAQASCAILVVAAAAIAGLGLPGLRTPAPAAAELPPSKAEPLKPSAASAPVSEGVDFDGIAQRLAAIDNAPKPVSETPTAGATPDPAATPADASIKFLGSILEPTRRIALININGRQRAVVPGQKLKLGPDPSAGELTLVAVDDDAITIEEKGVRRTIAKTARTGSAITTVAESAPPAPTPEAPPQQTGAGDAGLRNLRDAIRGMDPERRRQAIQEFQRARANRERSQENE